MKIPEENLGGAALPLVSDVLIEAGYDAIWIMDGDTYPHPDALEKFLQADKDLNSMAIWQGKVLWKDGSWCEMNTPKYQRRHGRGRVQTGRTVFFLYLCLFPRKSVATYGLPIKEFFIWGGDDVEYTREGSHCRSRVTW